MPEEVITVPLRVKSVPRRERASRAVREIKSFVEKRTDKEIRIDQDLNERLWERGAQKPPTSVRVRLVEEPDRMFVHPEDKDVSTGTQDEFECEECGKTFSTEKGLETHMDRSHEEEEAFVCGVCDKEFDTKRGLSIHESQVHSEEEDYEDVLSGTISEGKEKIEDMENPDYEKLLEIEKDNKDRKGMKQYLEKELEE